MSVFQASGVNSMALPLNSRVVQLLTPILHALFTSQPFSLLFIIKEREEQKVNLNICYLVAKRKRKMEGKLHKLSSSGLLTCKSLIEEHKTSGIIKK
jgi:hypothetical protein